MGQTFKLASHLLILPSHTVMIRLSGHVYSWSLFPDKRVFRITESPISRDV